MNNKSRLAKLEKQSGTGERKKYFCVFGLESSEEKLKGYKVQPCPIEYGGTGGEPFYLKTRKELDEFAARPDVDLETVEIVYTDEGDATE